MFTDQTLTALGCELRPDQQREALRTYVHRFTGNHRPSWSTAPRPDGSAYPVQFADDADWLRNTRFAVTKDGALSRRNRYCASSPTWPHNPELRRPA
jgi:hypothetical protein